MMPYKINSVYTFLMSESENKVKEINVLYEYEIIPSPRFDECLSALGVGVLSVWVCNLIITLSPKINIPKYCVHNS